MRDIFVRQKSIHKIGLCGLGTSIIEHEFDMFKAAVRVKFLISCQSKGNVDQCYMFEKG